MRNIIAYLILSATIGFNLWLNYPETQILADPNDNIFQFSLVGRTNWVWENYGCPLSLSCLPNLVDHNVPNWAEGYPLPFYYSHAPQIAIVSSYHLLIQPLTKIFNSQFSIYNYYNWTKYLLLTLFPLSVFLALRIVGFSPVLSALGAFFSANFSTDGLYGIDPPSYLWRGYGLTSQLYAIVFLPLAIAFTYKALINTLDLETGDAKEGSQTELHKEAKIKNTFYTGCLKRSFGFTLNWFTMKGYLSGRTRKLLSNNSFLAILFLSLTTAGHLGVGIISILSTLSFLFLDFKGTNIISRFKKLFLILAACFLVLSYWIVPILLNNNYHIISFWDPIWKFNSYGWYEVVKQFFNGEIFDWQRFPIITALTATGFFVLAVRKKFFPFALLFALWFLLYFGRTTWGGLIDLIPGMKDFHQHRFVVGIHVAALFLIPAGLEYIFALIRRITHLVVKNFAGRSMLFEPFASLRVNTLLFREACPEEQSDEWVRKKVMADLSKMANINIIFYILIFIFISLLAYFTTKQTVAYATLNNKWIYQANDAYRYDEANFKNLLTAVDKSKGRIYAGRPGNWGKDFRLGSTQLYLLLGGIGYDISQFLPETWSPLSENEQNFDEREALDFDLLNIRYVVSEKNHDFAKAVKLENKYGPFELYQAPTTGWFDIVTSPMFVKTDKTNYINLVHLWWNSYPRRWKMNPLISVDKNPKIPDGMQKVIEMKDEVNYELINPQPTTHNPQLNIFSDFPFVFPEATISAKINEEKVTKQTYSATIDVPNNCKQCMAMFKMSYHPNWQVRLDGKETEKFAVFPFYLATPVSPGTHTVEFTYQPNRLKVILLAGEILAGIILFIKVIL